MMDPMAEWKVRLPRGAREPYTVFVNGVRQEPGSDYEVRGDALVFNRPLAKDRISKGRWFLGAWGIGTYRKDDSVDVTWTAPDGTPRVAHRLEIEVEEGA
jgi:hypothetical protein